MNKSLVSILIPCYNVEEYLSHCLNSIINQTYSNLQIVLINDGSKDNTWEIMQDYAAKDSRIEIYNQQNQGVAITRNHLLEKVKGDYVLFIDSDDWCEFDMVEFLVNKALKEKSDIVICSMVKNDESFDRDEYKEEAWDQSKVIYEFLCHQIMNGSLCNKLIKSSLLHDIQFHAEISYGEDALFCWNVLQRVNNVTFTDKVLYHYRMNDNSISHKLWTPDNKGSGRLVWEKITNETENKWPQYGNVVKVRAALEDMWALYYASFSAYRFDEHIQVRQNNVRKNLRLIVKSDIPSFNMKIYACLASLSYNLLKYLHRI